MTETQTNTRSIQDLTIRLKRAEDDEQMVSIGNRINADFPPTTVEEMRHWVSTRPADTFQERWVAERGGKIVAGAALIEMYGTARKGTYFGWVEVDPDHWRQGIGGCFYDHLLQRALEVGVERLYGEFREHVPDVEQFALHRGFERTGRVARLSRLEVHAANLDGYEDAEERLHSHGLRIATVAEIGVDDEEFLRALHRMEFESERDIPSSEEMAEPWPFEIWRQRRLESPSLTTDRIWVALDGRRPVGIAALGGRGDSAFNNYTGVDREYRGRGVARALKLRTIEWCRANGVDYIYTGNDVENKRMLSINIRLGYEQLPGEVEVVKVLKDS